MPGKSSKGMATPLQTTKTDPKIRRVILLPRVLIEIITIMEAGSSVNPDMKTFK